MRRGLVIAGGGAKGAYSFGAMQALKIRGFVFEAVSGTSAGSLNAAIWASGDLEAGETLWSQIRPENSYERSWWLRFLPRPLSRIFGALSVLISMVAARMTGSPIDGENESNVEMIIGCVPFACVLILMLVYNPGSWPWYELIFVSFVTAILSAYMPSFFMSDAFPDDKGPKSFGMAVTILILPFLISQYSAHLLIDRLSGNGLWDYLTTPFCYIFVYALSLILILLAAEIFETLLLSITVLDSEPLRKTLVNYLHNRPFRMPIYVTVASRKKIFDPDDPTWRTLATAVSHTPAALRAADEEGPWEAVQNSRWIPTYFSIRNLDAEQAAEILLASSALPFGIVKSRKIDEINYVDGGVVDNIPILPLLQHKLDEIVVLDLSPAATDGKKVDHPMRCALLARLKLLERQPLPPRAHGRHPGRERNSPPVRFPCPTLPFPTKITVLRPKLPLGGIFSGTLNFSPGYAAKMIELGRDETLGQLDALESK